LDLDNYNAFFANEIPEYFFMNEEFVLAFGV